MTALRSLQFDGGWRPRSNTTPDILLSSSARVSRSAFVIPSSTASSSSVVTCTFWAGVMERVTSPFSCVRSLEVPASCSTRPWIRSRSIVSATSSTTHFLGRGWNDLSKCSYVE